MSHGSIYWRTCLRCLCLLGTLQIVLLSHAAPFYLEFRLYDPDHEFSSVGIQQFFGGSWSTHISSIGYNSSLGAWQAQGGPIGSEATGPWRANVVGLGPVPPEGVNGTYSAFPGGIIEFNTPPPESWHLDETIVNDSAEMRRYGVDIDCDGQPDYVFMVPPGESTRLQVSTDEEPCGEPKILVETYLGDAQWAFEEVASIDEGNWEENEPPASSSTNSFAATPPPPDTHSITNPVIAFPTPSGTNVSGNEFRTGIEALRTAQIDNSQEIVEAIDRLRVATTNALGQNANTNAMLSSLLSHGQTSSNLVKGSLIGQTNFWGTNFGANIGSGTKPPAERLHIPLGTDARWGSISIDPDDYPILTDFMAFGKSVATWFIWFLYGGWLLYTVLQNMKLAAQTPSQPSASQIPAASWALAIGAALLVAVIITAVGVTTMAVIASEMQSSLWANANAWRGWTFLAEVIWWGERFVPLQLTFGLILSLLPTRLALDGTFIAVMSAIRATTA